MFHPVDHPMERGWVGRIDGEHVTHLAAQTLQSFFTGGGSAREHAVYPLEEVRLLAPVLHPPTVRIFEDEVSFTFANPAAIVGPGGEVERSERPSDTLSQGILELFPRVAAVVGADGVLGGFTALAECRDRDLPPPKDRDFALGLGPVVVTPDELDVDSLEASVRVDGHERLRESFGAFDWEAARALAADGTILYPGDLLVGPAPGILDGLESAQTIEVEIQPLGALALTVA